MSRPKKVSSSPKCKLCGKERHQYKEGIYVRREYNYGYAKVYSSFDLANEPFHLRWCKNAPVARSWWVRHKKVG